MRFLPILILTLLWTSPLWAAETVTGDTIKMDDGRIVRLLGIKSEAETAKPALQSLIDHQDVILESANTDRYGRIAADVYVTSAKNGKIWLQGELLKQGLAFVFPPTGSEPHLDELLKLEQGARKRKLGLWSNQAYADLPADKPDAIAYGHFAFVRGKVVKVERIKNILYLNFGADWHTDFTIVIAAHDLRLFKRAGIDPLDYQGKSVRVRGWVKRTFGPMISVTHPAQIEMLGEASPKH